MSRYRTPSAEDIEEMPSPNGSRTPANVTGRPSLNIPCGTGDGLPIGLQLLGQWYGDRLLFDVATEYERLAGE